MHTHFHDDIQEPLRGELESILRSCVHCGFCNATCPTYQLQGDELDGPRGRIYLIKQVLEGKPATRLTQQHLDRCLTCRSCETTCPSGVQYGRLLDAGRVIVDRQAGRACVDRLMRFFMLSIFPYRQRFAALLKVAQWFKPVLPSAI
ncbi:MAG TPA: 4Fe-4S dicluster domain-containing protein, partial [Methylomicrobium sp.]|nr:4Fe-4S dicluster domain-containing protein [Methylomicrobium sp.]